MRVVPFLAAAALAALSIWLYGPELSWLLLLAIALLALGLLHVAFPPEPPAPDLPWIVVDGSNVMHWDGDTPSLVTVRKVLAVVKDAGFVPLVWFDANVGYLTQGQYMRPQQLSRMLGLHAGQVLVAPKGTPADPLLLEEAVRMDARVITNDRFRDWAATHPKVAEPGFLVRGRVQNGRVTLRLGEGVR